MSSAQDTKFAIVILSPHDAPEHRGRMIHALELARELKEAGATFRVLLGGRGVEWVPFLLERDGEDVHPYAKHYGHLMDNIKDDVTACNMCGKRFGQYEALERHGVEIEGEGKAHLSLGRLALEGWQVLTF